MSVPTALAILQKMQTDIGQAITELQTSTPAPTPTPPPAPLPSSVVTVKVGDNLQRAIDTAAPGTTIRVAPGLYDGITLRYKGVGVAPITIRPDTTNIPADGQRVTPSFLSALVSLRPNAGPIGCAITNEPRAEGYNLIGLRTLAGDPGVPHVWLGDDVQNDPAFVPHSIVIDRCLILADPTKGGKRGIMANTRGLAVVNSYIDDFWFSDDSQAIAGWNGPGPFLIQNNYLAASAENVLFGGGDARSAAMLPASLTMRFNYVTKKPAWKTASGLHTVKNLLEFKAMLGALVEYNLFENCWQGYSQDGYGLVITPRNQDGSAPFTEVRDIVFQHNIVRGCGAGINMLGRDDRAGYTTQPLRNVKILDNIFYNITWTDGSGRLVQIVHGGQNIEIAHNTMIGAPLNSFFTADAEKIDGLNMHDNVLAEGAYGMVYTATGLGKASWDAATVNSRFENNLIERGPSIIDYPGTTNGETTSATSLAVDRKTLKLLPGYATFKSSDGKPVGADVDAIVSAVGVAL